MSKFMDKLKGPGYHDVIDDLKAFTGLNDDQLEKRIHVRDEEENELWWNHEFMHFRPIVPNEYAWFYCAAQSYVFTNARKAYWSFIDDCGMLSKNNAAYKTVLDFGAGIGQNCLELKRRNYSVHYYDLNYLQKEFFKFRLKRRSFQPSELANCIVEPFMYSDQLRFKTLPNLLTLYNFILLPHVLEHIPNYQKTLEYLISFLVYGGYILEHTPFARYKDTKNIGRPKMHLEDDIGIGEVMNAHGMELVKGDVPNIEKIAQPRVWKKS